MIIEYILCLLDCTSFFVFFYTLYRNLRFSKSTTFLIFLFESIVCFLISIRFVQYYRFEYMYSNILTTVVLAVFQLLIFKDELFHNRISIIIAFLLVVLVTGILASIIDILLFPIQISEFVDDCLSFAYQIISIFFCYKVAGLIRDRCYGLDKNLLSKYLLMIIFPVISQYLIYSLFYKYHTKTYSILLIVSVLSTATLMFSLYKQLKVDQESMQNLIFTKLSMASKEQMNTIIDNEEKLREMRHDLKNHLMVIKTLNDENKKEELDQYIQELGSIFSYTQPKVYCQNVYLNALLNNKVSEFSNIHFDILIHPDFCGHFNDIDLCILVSNLLDNAIYELTRHSSLNQTIDVSLNEKDTFQTIKVSNPLSRKKDLKTEKEDLLNHGLGISIVEKIVKKYNGEMVINQSDEFEVKIVFCLK